MPCNKSRRILTGYLIERLVFIIAGKNVIPVQATCDIFWIRVTVKKNIKIGQMVLQVTL